MQETLHYRRNTGFTKGVRTLDRVRVIAFAFLILLLASPGTGARDYIEVSRLSKLTPEIFRREENRNHPKVL
jgi:hypothetical protein